MTAADFRKPTSLDLEFALACSRDMYAAVSKAQW